MMALIILGGCGLFLWALTVIATAYWVEYGTYKTSAVQELRRPSD